MGPTNNTPVYTPSTMAPPESRSSGDRASNSTVYYNMKTSRPPPQPTTSKPHSAHSYASSVSHARSLPTNPTKTAKTSSSPMASPRGLASTQPKLSPSSTSKTHLTTPVSQVSAQEARTPSPNYFGLQVEASVDAHESSSSMPRENWGSGTSSVKSYGAILPQQLPLDANPEFEAFRRQADANRGRSSFNLGSSHFGLSTPLCTGSGAAVARPRPSRWNTHASDMSAPPPQLSRSATSQGTGISRTNQDHVRKVDNDVDANSMCDSAYVSSNSTQSSEASPNPPTFLNMPRHESPAQFESPFEKRSGLSRIDDHHPRLSMMHGKADPPTPQSEINPHTRSNTVPATLDHGAPGMISPTHLKDLLQGDSKSDVLLLDLRVSPQFAQSRIRGSLNLCIPTTLLKRATFNLQKLQQTFQAPSEQEAFARWKDTKNLVVYDAFSSEKRDAVSAMNTIKKFTNEGYTGTCSILRGGFNAFLAAYPALIDHGQIAAQKPGRPTLMLGGASKDGAGPSVAPVVGGVMLPTSSNAPNPFFSNIRQNQDLIGGVGQMDVRVPPGADSEALPRWLQEAANFEDHGKNVSDRFLNIELEEQKRMKGAYSYINPAMANEENRKIAANVQLSGIEKGGKNRYKDILPFEHARVRLEGKPEGTCDYINASHIKASRSHKRYIASQGPLPATFEDFWSVIWDQDVRVIVMLTAESEGGQLKCHPYWKDKEFGLIKLRALSEKKASLDIDRNSSPSARDATESNDAPSGGQPDDAFGFGAAMAANDLGRRRANTTTTLESSPQSQAQPQKPTGETPYVIIRKFALSHSAHPFAPIREITQLHYPSWPDFGTPAQPSHLLALVELANVMQHSSLPVDVPSTLASAHNFIGPEFHAKNAREKLSPSPKKRSRSSSNIPLAWWDAPESDQATHPMLVHCSAGCGRTGTFCTVDSVIDMLKRQRIRNIKKANENIERKVRGHRLMGPPKQDSDGDIAMSGFSYTALQTSTRLSRSNPFDDAISPGTKSPQSPAFPNLSTAMSMSPSPPSATSSASSDDDDEPHLDTSWVDDDTLDLIASTVHDFRGQRLSMVQTLRQYVLCYETVIEWVWRLQERGGPAGSVIGAPGTGAGGTAAARARGRAGTVAHVAHFFK